MGRTGLNLDAFNAMAVSEAKERLLQCCHSQAWARKVVEARPFASKNALFDSSEKYWLALSESDWLEAFEAHPEIGNAETLKEKFRATKAMASSEQARVVEADEPTLQELFRLNQEYKKKFGFLFIVFATGKSALEMLAMLKQRVSNTRPQELQNAAQEQWKITQLRLEKIL